MKKNLSALLISAFAITLAYNGKAQTNNETKVPPGIEIVKKLDDPKGNFSEKDYVGYVFVYFKDQTHCGYLAISKDGYNFIDVNNGQPVFDGTILAEQKGVRNPHIARGPDGAFYLAMTDLHISGQRAGYRETQWQRPQEKYGWGNNRALVLMKSYDLIHWTHSDFRVDLAFPELGDIDCSWAPETVYDPIEKKMMVYFTIRYNNAEANMYYSYANNDFTKLATSPKMMTTLSGIDGDIFKLGDKYHMHYVAGAKVLHAVSDKINGDYVAETRRIDPETVSTEAPNVFQRLGTDTYVLMYDVYGARPNNMGYSETKDFKTYTDIGHFNEGVMKGTNFERPKHGAITYMTLDELKAVAEHWNIDIDLE